MAEHNRRIDGRGGARPGAGRKPTGLSAARMQEMLEEVKNRELAEGKTLLSILLDEAYSKRDTKLSAARYIIDKTTITITEGSEADRALGPAAYLPEQRPALEAIEGGKAHEA